MSDQSNPGVDPPTEPKPVIMKGVPIAGQAERLVRVRREITHADEMTKIEQIEAEARDRAETILGEAKEQAEEIVGKARAEADSIRSKAREDGDLAAKREALQKLEGLISNLEKEIHSLQNARADFLKANLSGVMEFACAVARKVLISELSTRPRAIAERARALLDRMPPGSTVTLTANPDDIEIIETYLHETGGPADAILPGLRADPELGPGGLRLECDSGRIDAHLLKTLDDLGSLLCDQSQQFIENCVTPTEDENGG